MYIIKNNLKQSYATINIRYVYSEILNNSLFVFLYGNNLLLKQL